MTKTKQPNLSILRERVPRQIARGESPEGIAKSYKITPSQVRLIEIAWGPR